MHLLIHPRNEDYPISEILKSIKQPVARKAINYLRRWDSPILGFMETGNESPRWRFWQNGGGYDRNITVDKKLIRFIEYIHDNPVRRGLVERAEEWKWSSARQWLMEEETIIRIDRESFDSIII